MHRTLAFEPNDAQKRYILCYQALCFAKAPLERNELRAHGALLTALEGIGERANPNAGENDTPLYRCPAGGQIEVDGDQYNILKRFLGAFVPEIHRSLTREMDGALRWLDDAPEARPVTSVSRRAVRN